MIYIFKRGLTSALGDRVCARRARSVVRIRGGAYLCALRKEHQVHRSSEADSRSEHENLQRRCYAAICDTTSASLVVQHSLLETKGTSRGTMFYNAMRHVVRITAGTISWAFDRRTGAKS